MSAVGATNQSSSSTFSSSSYDFELQFILPFLKEEKEKDATTTTVAAVVEMQNKCVSPITVRLLLQLCSHFTSGESSKQLSMFRESVLDRSTCRSYLDEHSVVVGQQRSTLIF
jgi:hypothetical protein